MPGFTRWPDLVCIPWVALVRLIVVTLITEPSEYVYDVRNPTGPGVVPVIGPAGVACGCRVVLPGGGEVEDAEPEVAAADGAVGDDC